MVKSLMTAILGRRSFKTVLHGEPGVGKSSILNLVLYLPQEKYRYVAIKVDVNETLLQNPNLFIKELLNHLGRRLIDNALRTEGILGKLRAFITERAERTKLRRKALLALMYSSERLTLQEGRENRVTGSARLGVTPIDFELSVEDASELKVITEQTRIPGPLLSDILNGTVDLIGEIGLEGIIIGIDNADKLTDEKYEENLLSILKSIFYPRAKYHLLVVLAERNGRKKVMTDIFSYERVLPLSRRDFLKSLEALYKTQVIDERKPLRSIVSEEVLNLVYQKSAGRLRDAIVLLARCIDTACLMGKTIVDTETYESSSAADEITAYLRSLGKEDSRLKVLRYLLKNKSTYTRDQDLLDVTDLTPGRISQILYELRTRGIISEARKSGRRILYSLDISAEKPVRRFLEAE